MNFSENLLNVWNTQEIQEVSGFGNVGQNTGLMFKGFPTQTIEKSKMSQEEEEEGEGNEVNLGFPCGRQKSTIFGSNPDAT